MSKYKIEKIKLNLSFGRLNFAKCKSCYEGPTYYFKSATAETFYNPSYIKKHRAPFKIRTDYFFNFDPSTFHDIYSFSFQTYFKSFDPRKNRIKVLNGEESRIIECLSCECGLSIWYFKNNVIKNRPEIAQRRARYAFPKVFIY